MTKYVTNFGAGLGLLISSAIGCAKGPPPCTDEDAFTSLAPDGQHRIIARYSDCGGTATAVYLSVVAEGRRVPLQPNAAVIDCSANECNRRTVTALWRYGRRVTVYYPEGARLVESRPLVADVELDYVSQPP